MRYIYIILLSLVSLASNAQTFPYRYLPPITIAPTEETNCMFFDKEGMMWVGTNAGVKSYDGYTCENRTRSNALSARHPTQQ